MQEILAESDTGSNIGTYRRGHQTAVTDLAMEKAVGHLKALNASLEVIASRPFGRLGTLHLVDLWGKRLLISLSPSGKADFLAALQEGGQLQYLEGVNNESRKALSRLLQENPSLDLLFDHRESRQELPIASFNEFNEDPDLYRKYINEPSGRSPADEQAMARPLAQHRPDRAETRKDTAGKNERVEIEPTLPGRISARIPMPTSMPTPIPTPRSPQYPLSEPLETDIPPAVLKGFGLRPSPSEKPQHVAASQTLQPELPLHENPVTAARSIDQIQPPEAGAPLRNERAAAQHRQQEIQQEIQRRVQQESPPPIQHEIQETSHPQPLPDRPGMPRPSLENPNIKTERWASNPSNPSNPSSRYDPRRHPRHLEEVVVLKDYDDEF